MFHKLEIDSVQKSVNGRLLLTDIYLKCSTQEIVGIIGRNGVGKSTLLKIIYGILPASFSSVRVDGRPIRKAYLLAQTMAYLPSHPFVPGYLAVEKAVELYLGKEAINCFFDNCVLFASKRAKVSQISAGERRILEIKLILQLPAKFVLLDNPFSFISPLYKDDIRVAISSASKERGIIVTDLDFASVLEISNKLYILDDGFLKEQRLDSK